MSYINLDPNYFQHPKVIGIKNALGPVAEVIPIKLWCYCAKYSPRDGIIKNMTPETLGMIVEFKGDAKAMLKCMQEHCLVKIDEKKNLEIVDWKEHQGHIYALKLRGRRAARIRWSRMKNGAKWGIKEKQPESDAKAMQGQCLGNAPYHTIPFHTNPDINTTEGSKKNATPEESKPHQRVVKAYKQLLGMNPDNGKWDSVNRHAFIQATQLLKQLDGNLRDAVACLWDVGKPMIDKGMTPSIYKIAQYAQIWKSRKSEVRDEDNRERT